MPTLPIAAVLTNPGSMEFEGGTGAGCLLHEITHVVHVTFVFGSPLSETALED